MTPQLLSTYAPAIRDMATTAIADPLSTPALAMEQLDVAGRAIHMLYAPFDHVNRNARIAIVGMTPGRFQAVNALRTAQEALQAGQSVESAAEKAKVFASFSGEPMRGNLVRMLDLIGVADLLGLPSTASLWGGNSELVHFTSALRYPVFVDGQNWSGQPDMVRTPPLRSWLETYTGTELSLLPEAVIVPLGPKVAAAMRHLAQRGMIDASRILDGLPHPSGANAERIAYFLGDKAAELCSTKTNTTVLDSARKALHERVRALR
ncbi:hypothetical protein BRX36_16020 [Sphingomonas sp. S-NIH.Pt1_0416]|nr:hypothetical protein BRX36_16020 [Sphingomonas sp. S-NIH.Pt1_0416]